MDTFFNLGKKNVFLGGENHTVMNSNSLLDWDFVIVRELWITEYSREGNKRGRVFYDFPKIFHAELNINV